MDDSPAIRAVIKLSNKLCSLHILEQELQPPMWETKFEQDPDTISTFPPFQPYTFTRRTRVTKDKQKQEILRYLTKRKVQRGKKEVIHDTRCLEILSDSDADVHQLDRKNGAVPSDLIFLGSLCVGKSIKSISRMAFSLDKKGTSDN